MPTHPLPPSRLMPRCGTSICTVAPRRASAWVGAWLTLLTFVAMVFAARPASASPLGPSVPTPLQPGAGRTGTTVDTPWPGFRSGIGASPGGAIDPLLAPPRGSSGRIEEEEDDGGEIAQPDAPKRGRQVKTQAPKVLVGKRNVPPFWLKREYETHTTSALYLPPLYIHKKPKPGHDEEFFHANLALTFGWYDPKSLKKRVINPAVLFFGGFSESRAGWAAVPLLMGYKRVGEQFRFGQFPLAWWWGSRYEKNFLIVPFHYQQKTPESFRGVSALLFWYGNANIHDADPNNDRKHFVGAPLYYSFTRGPKRFDFGILYVGGKNDARGVRHRTFWPFVHWSSHEFGNRKELWTLGWIRRTDKARGRSDWALPLALTFSTQNAGKGLMSVTPLYWRATDALRGSTLNVFGPVGTYADPRQRSQWVAPLFLRFEDRESGASASTTLPLYFARKTKDELTVHTLLGFGRGSRHGSGKGWGFGLHPALTYVGKREDGRAHAFAAGGLFWRFTNPNLPDGGNATWGVGPLVYGAKRGLDRHYGVMPLAAFGKKAGTKYQMITPLVWHARNREQDRNTWVIVPGYGHRKGDQWQAGLFPLYFGRGGDDKVWHFSPLLLSGHFEDKNEGWKRTITPVFVRGSGSRGSLTSAAVLYWDLYRKESDERHSVFAPLYYRRQVGDAVSHFTLLGAGKFTPDSKTVVTALGYGYDSQARKGFGAGPFVFHDNVLVGDDKGKTTVVPPLFARRRRESSDLDMWSPLVWRTANHQGLPRKNLFVVPFYGRQRQPGGTDIDGGFPWIWIRNHTRQTHTTVAGPVFHHLSRKSLHAGLAPVSWWMDSEEKRRLITLPLIWHFETKKTGERTTVAFPLWFDRIQPNGRRFWLAAPFVFHRKGQFNYTRAGVAALGYMDIFRLTRRRQRPDRPTSYRFRGWVPFYYRYDACGFREGDDPECRYTARGSFPFFMMGKDGKGRKTHAVSILYYHDKTPTSRKLYTLLGGYANEPGKRFMAYGLTFGIDTTNEWRTVTFLPLFWDKRNRIPDKDISTTWVLPPLYVGQHKEDRRWFQSTLLFWQFRTPVKVSTAVVPPVFFMQQAYQERNLHWLLPLYLRDNNMAKDTAWTWVFPGLYGAKRKGLDMTAIQFPLLWHFKRADKQTTIGVPLWYDIRRNGNKTQVVPLLYAGRHTAQKRTHVVGPWLASWSKNQPGAPDSRAWRALFGIAGGGTENGVRYGQVFWIKFPLGPEKAERAAKREDRQQRRQAKADAREARQQARVEARSARQQARADARHPEAAAAQQAAR